MSLVLTKFTSEQTGHRIRGAPRGYKMKFYMNSKKRIPTLQWPQLIKYPE